MGEPFWECEHAEETDASPAFAWSYWTDIRDWSDPPAEFSLDGAFAEGVHGTTRMPGQPPFHWVIGKVGPGTCARIDGSLEGASMYVTMTFEAVANGRTKITQRIELTGDNAAAYREVGEMFEANQPAGLKKLAAAMATAEQK